MIQRRTFVFIFILILSISFSAWLQSREAAVQSVHFHIPLSPTPVKIDGKVHLGYELHITNFRAIDVAVKRVEVLDAERGIQLADFQGSEVAARLSSPGIRKEQKDNQVIPAGMHAVFFLWLPLDHALPCLSSLKQRVELDIFESSGTKNTTVEVNDPDIRIEPPIILNAPLRGGPWAALYDPFMARGHRTSIYTINGRARIPARFAIDWIRLNDDATHARGDESLVSNWYGYGTEVLAVADAVVADSRDDITEDSLITLSQQPMPLENASGNYITLDLGKGRYAFYEHLKHGSIKVKHGEHVKVGQVIAQLGNSGSSSSGPHLHFHVSDANSTLAAEGLPYVFKTFQVLGKFDVIDAYTKGERWKSYPLSQTRNNELPAPNVVVMFAPQ